MSEDIDFAEIDKMMAAMEDDTKTKRSIAADVSGDNTVVKKTTVKPKAKIKSKSKKIVDNTPKEKTPEIVAVKIGTKPKTAEKKPSPRTVPNPKTGKFMDLVHPMSDMSSETRPDRKAPPVVVVKTVASQAISMSSVVGSIKDEPVATGNLEDALDLGMTVEDALAEFQAEVTDTVEKSLVDELDRLQDSTDGSADDMSYHEFDAPFLENVDVEKRPLGGDAIDDNPADTQPINVGREQKSTPCADEPTRFNKKQSRKQRKEAAKLAKTQAKHSKKHSGLGTFFNIVLVLAIITLGYIVGAIAYLSGMLEGLF